MSSPRGKSPSSWVPRKNSAVQAPNKVWAVTWACSQSGGGCNLWDQDCTGGVLSTASGNPPSFGSGNHIYFCISVEVDLSAHPNNRQPPTSPGVFGGASTPSPTLCCRRSFASHSLSSLSPLSALLEASVLLFLASCPLLLVPVRAC